MSLCYRGLEATGVAVLCGREATVNSRGVEKAGLGVDWTGAQHVDRPANRITAVEDGSLTFDQFERAN